MTTGASPHLDRRRRGRPRASDGANTWATILVAAREAFGELGYEGTSVREIAERAAVTRPMINHYFRSKEGLYEAVAEATWGPIVTAAQAGAADTPSVADRVRALLEAFPAAEAESQARFVSSSLIDAARRPELAAWTSGNLEKVRVSLRGAVQEGMDIGELRSDLDVEATVELLVAAVWGMWLYVGYIRVGERHGSLVERFTRLLDGRPL